MNEYMALTGNADDLPTFYVNTTKPLHSLLSSACFQFLPLVSCPAHSLEPAFQ